MHTDPSWDEYLATDVDPTGGRLDPDYDSDESVEEVNKPSPVILALILVVLVGLICSITAQAMLNPSKVEVPRPISSSKIKLLSVAEFKI